MGSARSCSMSWSACSVSHKFGSSGCPSGGLGSILHTRRAPCWKFSAFSVPIAWRIESNSSSVRALSPVSTRDRTAGLQVILLATSFCLRPASSRRRARYLPVVTSSVVASSCGKLLVVMAPPYSGYYSASIAEYSPDNKQRYAQYPIISRMVSLKRPCKRNG